MPFCSTSPCATPPADVEASYYGPRLSALVGLLGSAFLLIFSKTQGLLDQLLGIAMSRGAIAAIRERIIATLEQPMQEAQEFARQQPIAYVAGGIVVSDRFSAYNNLPLEQRQLCWAHLIRDLTAIAERPGATAEFGAQLLSLQQKLFGLWHR